MGRERSRDWRENGVLGRGSVATWGAEGGARGGRGRAREAERAGRESASPARRSELFGGGSGWGTREPRGPATLGAGMLLPVLLPRALLTCCGWLLARVSAPRTSTATPAPKEREPCAAGCASDPPEAGLGALAERSAGLEGMQNAGRGSGTRGARGAGGMRDRGAN